MEYIEHGLIPFEAKPLRGERLLVLAPHPDDEVIACGGLIAQHAADRRQVRVLIATDGAAAAPAGSPEDYRETREKEAREGLRLLGAPEPEFFRIPDRRLTATEELKARLREEIQSFRPDLIAAPSPVEIHPDHQALSRALFQLIEEDDELVRSLAVTQVAFFEVSQPIRPNLLLNITAEADKKWRAIAAHRSQTQLRAYQSFARGLNQYRAMTLPSEVLFAEAYAVFSLSTLRAIGWSELTHKVGGTHSLEVVRETLPITVVIRTKNRVGFLADALRSVESNTHPSQVVVVNDGGESPQEVTRDLQNVKLIDQQTSRGRSEAMNIGVRAASTKYIAFLDDDDRFYPDHLLVLANAAGRTRQAGYYTDALSVFLEVDENGDYDVRESIRIFAQDYDRELLLVDNYVPLTTLLLRRDDFLDAGGFDVAFDLFEDWEFLIRLTRRGNLLRIPRLTCEIRHLANGDSVILSKPEGTEAYREAKLQVWKRHDAEFSPALFARVLEKQKKKTLGFYSALVEERGRGSHLERDVFRLQREKETLLLELTTQADLRFRAEAEMDEGRLMAIELQRQIDDTRARLFEVSGEAAAAAGELEKHQTAVNEQGGAIQELYEEIERLNSVLTSIYGSKTWKLHSFVQSVRGKNG